MLEVRLLGQFDVRLDGKPIVIPSRSAQSLLAYLLLHPGTPHRREQLAGLLRPDTSDANARRNLRQELWRLRKAIDAEPSPEQTHLLADDISVTFDANAQVWLDAAALEQAGANCTTSGDLIGALLTYRGELLPGFYDEWVAPERERLQSLFEQLSARLVECLETEGRWAEVREWAERWIALGHSPEPAYRALMTAHSALGDMSKVASDYERCVTALGDDLGVEPSEQTRALYERLKSGASIPQVSAAQIPSLAGSANGDPAPVPGESPFKGLRYFDEADAGLFFGREQLTAQLVAHLREHTLLVVIGASGSGKSSLVRAGLIPAYRRGETLSASSAQAAVGGDLPVHLITPTAHPLETLAVTLSRDAESVTAIATLMDDMARDPRSLRLAVRRAVEPGAAAPWLLVVDQFEELFTLCRDEAERQAFVDNLLGVVEAENTGLLKMVMALRADFYAHCAQYANLRESVATSQAYIGPMSAAELRRSIEEPAQRGGWTLEPGLVELIVRDVGAEPGGLPLLSHALLETWQRRRGRTLTLKGYAESGGVRGAIAQTAETVFQQLTPEQQAIARHIFIQLTELGEGTQDTRRRVSIGELTVRAAEVPAVESVLNILTDARLVTVGEDTVEVAHEALIREWPTLREWLNQDREGLRLHRHLTEAAQAWQKLNRDPGELYRGARLAQAQEWAKISTGQLNPLEWEFLDASQAQLEKEEGEREAQRQRELAAAQQLAEAETERAEAQRKRAEAETRRAEAETSRAESERNRAEAETERAEAQRKRAEAEARRAADQAGANRRLRQRALFLVGALVLATLLAASSVILAQQSNQNAARAEDERRTAFVRELSVSAVNNLDIDPERSILLALQAVAVSSTAGKPVLREAEEALHRAIGASRVQLTLRGHTGSIVGIAFSADGKRLATASIDKTAKVWDPITGKELLTLTGHTDPLALNDIAFSPDGTRIVTGSSDKTAKVWDAVSGKELLTLRGHTDQIWGVAFSPDGTRVATASFDKTAKVWDLQSGRESLTLSGSPGGLIGIAFSPDGKRLVTGSWSDDTTHAARVWDAGTGKLLLTLTGHTNVVGAVAFSLDGQRVATGANDTTAREWDSTTGQSLLTLYTGSGVGTVAFSPDRTRLSTTSTSGSAKIWDATTGQLMLTLAGSVGYGVAFSPDGTRLATGANDVTTKVWDISPAGGRDWLTLAGHRDVVYGVAFSPDGTRIATASFDKTAKVWDALTGRNLLTLNHAAVVDDIAFSPDGSHLATVSRDQSAAIWDTATGKQLLKLSTNSIPSPTPHRVVFSPDGQRVATASAGGSTKVWDTLTGNELLTLCCHTATVVGIAVSADGTRLATTSLDSTAKVWDAATGKELLTLSGHIGLVDAVAFSRDGLRIATASYDGTAKVWDAASGQLLLTLSSNTVSLKAVAFSPDGTHLAVAGGTVIVWDVSAGSDRSAQPLTLYSPTAQLFFGVAFSPDGKRVAASSFDGTTPIFALPLDDIIAIAKSRVTRGLTTDECQKFLRVDTCPPAP